MSSDQAWVSEKWKNVETRYKIKSVLYDDNSEFQHTQIVDSYEYGVMLLLDGIVQTTEKDEFIYHEMMVHVPMLSHPGPENVLIIGGGDGGILREVLRYESVKNATMVEIDPGVIDLCRKFLPMINRGAFDDDRTNIIIADGAAFVKETEDKFDVVIVDSPDPVGPAKVLFSQDFYRDLHGLITENGVLVRQTGSVHLQRNEQREAYDILKDIFVYTEPYVFAVPTYVGGFFSAMFCSDTVDPCNIDMKLLEEKTAGNKIETEYYNPGIHIGAFHVPFLLKERLK